MVKKQLLAIFSILLIAAALTACGGNADADAQPTPTPDMATPEATASKPIIGLSLSEQNGYNQVFQDYFERAFEDSDYYVETVYADSDYNKQVADLADLLAQDVQLLILDPSDLDNLEYILSEYEVEEVPVINLNESVNAYTKMLIGPFYRNVGREIGEYTFERLAELTDYDYETNTVILRGSVDSSKMQGIYDGFMEAFEESRYNNLVGSPACNYDHERAKAAMADLLAEYPKIHCVFAETSDMAIAAIEAIDEAGAKGVMVTTVGGEPEALSYVDSGRIDATIMYGPNDMANVTAKYANRILADKLVLLPQFVELNYEILTPKNVSNYYNSDTVYALSAKSTELPEDPTPTPEPSDTADDTTDEGTTSE